MTSRTARKMVILLNSLLCIWILLHISLMIARFFGASWIQGNYVYLWGRLYVYGFFPVTCLIFIGLFLRFIRSGWRMLRHLRWSFLLLCTFFIMLLLNRVYLRHYSLDDKVELSVQNDSPVKIKYAKIHGRHELVEMENLLPGNRKDTLFYGSDIDYHTRNHYENQIFISYMIGGHWYKHQIVGTWRVIREKISVNIVSGDSVGVRSW